MEPIKVRLNISLQFVPEYRIELRLLRFEVRRRVEKFFALEDGFPIRGVQVDKLYIDPTASKLHCSGIRLRRGK